RATVNDMASSRGKVGNMPQGMVATPYNPKMLLLKMPYRFNRGYQLLAPRSLSDSDLSTAANDPRPSASCSARKNPQRIPANTPPVFPGLRPRIWPHLLGPVTNGNVGQAPRKAESQ